jgi:hypothetical protein
MTLDLSTTNAWLGVIAVVSVLEALLIVGIAIGGFVAYRRVMAVVASLEERQVAPAVARVNAILDDVKQVSATVREETARVDQALHATMGRVDETVGRVRTNVKARTSRLVGILRGARVAIETLLVDTDRNGRPT